MQKSKDVSGFLMPFSMAWNNFTTLSYPWLLMGFVTAISTGFLSDWSIMNKGTGYARRLLDGVIQLFLLAGTVLLVYLWLSDLENARVPDIQHLLVMTASIGFMIGYIVPSWYRGAYCLTKLKVSESIVE